MYLVTGETIREAYLNAINTVFKYGDKVNDERRTVTTEILNMVSTITYPEGYLFPINPLKDIPKGSVWNEERLNKYKKEFLTGDKKGFVYTYGERLFGNDCNQIRKSMERLNENLNTRRATSVTLRPRQDQDREDIPCLILVDFKVRDGVLFTTGVWRSHDIYGAYFPNLVGLYSVAKYVKEHVDGINSIGEMTIQSISAHIYETDYASAKELLENNGA